MYKFTETEPITKPVFEPVRPTVKNDPETVSNTKTKHFRIKHWTSSSFFQVIKQNLDNARNGLLLLQLEPQSRQQLEFFLHRQLIEEEELHVRHYNELQKFLNACKCFLTNFIWILFTQIFVLQVTKMMTEEFIN